MFLNGEKEGPSENLKEQLFKSTLLKKGIAQTGNGFKPFARQGSMNSMASAEITI